MTNQAYPSVDGIAPSWADIACTATVDGGALLEMADIAGIKWSRKVTVGEQKNGGRVVARTTGELATDASATLYRSGLRKLVKALAAKAPTRGNQQIIGYVSFDIMIQHTPPGETEIYQTKMKGCRYLGESDDMKEGTDADKIEVTLNPIEIVQLIAGKEIVLL